MPYFQGTEIGEGRPLSRQDAPNSQITTFPELVRSPSPDARTCANVHFTTVPQGPSPKNSTATATLPSRHILQYVTGTEQTQRRTNITAAFSAKSPRFQNWCGPRPRRPHLRRGLFYNGSAGYVPKNSTNTATLPSRHILQYVTRVEGNSKGNQYNRRVFWPNHRVFRTGASPASRHPHLRKGLFYNGSAGPVPKNSYNGSAGMSPQVRRPYSFLHKIPRKWSDHFFGKVSMCPCRRPLILPRYTFSTRRCSSARRRAASASSLGRLRPLRGSVATLLRAT